MKNFIGKRIAVVGDGDSSKVITEWLMRLAPEASYGEDVAGQGDPEEILVYGKYKNCEEFLEKSRTRYFTLVGPIRRGSVKLLAKRVQRIELNGNGKIVVVTGDGSSPEQVDILFNCTGFTYSSSIAIEPSDIGQSYSPILENGLSFFRITRQHEGRFESGIFLAGPRASEDFLNLNEAIKRNPSLNSSISLTAPRTEQLANSLGSAIMQKRERIASAL